MLPIRIRRRPARWPIAVAALSTLVALPAQSDRRAKLAGTTDSYSDVKHQARRLQFFQDALVADYRSRRSEETPADPEAEKLLRRYAECWERNLLGDEPVLRRLRHQTRTVLHRGEDDPLVLLVAGDVVFMGSQFDRAEPMFRKATRELEARSQSALVKHHAFKRFYSLLNYRGSEEEKQAMAARCDDLLVLAIADPAFGGGNERFYLERVFLRFRNNIPAGARELVDRMAKVEGAHRYPLLLIDGQCHVSEGWAARGSGFAPTVTEDGWKGFGGHLADAARCFATAHELVPEHPEAPAAMVKVCSALDLPDEDRDEWFDRALAAQFDYSRAHYDWLYFSLPRWGGTHLDMMQFGRDCAATGRFDTVVPDLFRSALSYISWDYEDTSELYGTAIVQKTLAAVHEGYLGQHRSQSARVRELSDQVVLLWLGERVAEAAALYQSIDGEFDEAVFERYRGRKEVFTEAIEPHLKPHVPKRVADFDVFDGFEAARYDSTYEPQPIPVGAQAFTSAQLAREQAGWTKTVSLAAYREHGSRDARWDADAEEFLATYPEIVFQGGDAATLSAYRDQGEALLEAGCDDPQVRYVAGRACEYAGKGERAFELVEQSVAALDKSSYPKLFSFYATRRLESMLRALGRTEAADALRPVIIEHAVAMAVDPCFSGKNARYYVTTVVPPLDVGWAASSMTEAGAEKMLANDAIDGWIRHTMAGLVHVAAAVNEPVELLPAEARAPYFAHLQKAAEHLVAAHALHPEFPEPAAAMVTVRMLELGEATPRAWFDRAVAAQVDYDVAYRNFLWTLRRDWGGSSLATYRFGVECLDTGAFDTGIPLYFLRALESAALFLENWRWAWSSPDSVRRYETLAQGIIAARPDTSMASYVDRGRYMTAWAGGRYAEAVAGWKAAGEVIDPQWCRRLRVEKEAVEKDLRVF